MSVSFIASSAVSSEDGAGGTSFALALGAAVAIGDCIVGMGGADTIAQDISTVTDSLGNSYSLNSDKTDDATNGQWGRTFTSTVTVAGTPTVTVNYTASVGNRRMMLAGYTGTGSPPFDKSAGNQQASPGTGTDAVTSGSVTTTANGDMVVGFHQNTAEALPGTGTVTQGTGFTARHTNNAVFKIEDQTQGTAGSIAATFTISNNHATIAHVVAIKSSDVSLALSGNSASGRAGFAGIPNTAIVDFGPFPGVSDAKVLVPDSGVGANSLIEAWLRPVNTPDHLADEHLVETIRVIAHSPVAGVGFTISGINTNELSEPLAPGGEGRAASATVGAQSGDGQPRIGGIGTRIYGAWSVSWVRL